MWNHLYPEGPISFSLAIMTDFSKYNVAVTVRAANLPKNELANNIDIFQNSENSEIQTCERVLGHELSCPKR